MTIDEKIAKCKENIEGYEKMLKLMPEDTLLGRLCVQSYLKRERKKLDALREKKATEAV